MVTVFGKSQPSLLSQGIAVFAPNVRGSSGFGKKYVHLDDGALRANGVRDIKACVDHVVSTGIADPKRVGISGGSYGGYMTMAGLTEYPDLFAAGANLFGIVNFETFFQHTEPWMAAISTTEYGDPATQGPMLRSLSPIHKLDKVKAQVGEAAYAAGRYEDAAGLMIELVEQPVFTEFLTLPAYDRIVADESKAA